jgi:hypothetical protein
VPQTIHQLLVTRQVIMPSNIKHGVYCLMAKNLGAIRTPAARNDFYAVLIRQPNANAPLAVLPSAWADNSDVDGMGR